MQVEDLAFWLIGIGMVVYGLYRLYQAYTIYRNAYAGKTWPATTGRVTGGHFKERPGFKYPHYWAEFNYSYMVLGSEYRRKFKMDSIMGEPFDAAGKMREYPVGYIFFVHYNPDKPQECVTEFDKVNIYTWFMTLFFISPALFWIIQLFHLWK